MGGGVLNPFFMPFERENVNQDNSKGSQQNTVISFPSIISCLISFGIHPESYFLPPVKGKSNIHWNILCGLVGQLLRKNIQVFFGLLKFGLFTTHLLYSFTAHSHFATLRERTV